MKKFIYLCICLFFLTITSCEMKSCAKIEIMLENNKVVTYYLDDKPEDALKKINLLVKKSGKESLVALSDDLVSVTNFNFDETGEFTAKVTYDDQTVDLKYKVEIRKWDNSKNTSWYQENLNEFEIKNASELAGLALLVNNGNDFTDKTIKLKYDIDLNNLEWIPIGTSGKGVFNDMSKSFNGTFDGNNKTIYNLMIKANHKTNGEHIEEKSSYYHAGLFGYCKNVTIKDLKLENVDILNGMGNNYKRSLQGTGCLVGRINGTSSISNVKVLGDVKVSGEYKVGGLIGSITGTKIVIDSCCVKANKDSYVQGTDALYKDTNNFGGIVGYVDTSEAIFKKVYTDILVSGFTSGGIIGNITEGTLSMEDICVYGDVVNSEGSFVGGLIGGRFIQMNLKNCYMLGSVKINNETNLYGDVIVSKYGETETDIKLENVYYNNENFDESIIFNSLNAVGKTYNELLNMIPTYLK